MTMSQTPTVAILNCGHIAIRPGQCATTDCPNFVGDSKRNWVMEVFSMIAVAGILVWVRSVTGRGALDIILDALPPLFSVS